MLLLSEDSIRELIDEAKPIPEGISPLTRMVERNRHLRRDFEITSKGGNEFVIKIRQSTVNVFDFSVVLGHRLPGVNTIFLLRRYNGKHGSYHTNPIENVSFRDFHIHIATERYQKLGPRAEHFAEITKRYADLDGAISCLLEDCGFRKPIAESSLFTGTPIE